MRQLISTRRQVPPEHTERYDDLWAAVRGAAQAAGAQAWRFRAADGGGGYMEFLEGAGPELEEAGLRAAVRALDEALEPERTDHWEEA